MVNKTRYQPTDPLSHITPNWWGVPIDARLCTGLRDFFKKDARANQVFRSNIFDYKRDCNQSRELPALLIYPDKTETHNQSYNDDGNVRIDAVMPVKLMLESKTKVGQQIKNYLDLRFKTSDILEDIESYTPGIIELGLHIDSDYSYLTKEKSQDAYVLKYNVKYRIDPVKYWEWLLNHGYSVQDPQDLIYPEVTGYDLDFYKHPE